MRAAMKLRSALCWAAIFFGYFTLHAVTTEEPPEMSGVDAQGQTVATYSIVAVDEHTGEIGAAVLSHWFSVGSLVTWAEAGVGAVATQGFIDPGYGPEGLEALRKGASAEKAMRRLLKKDEQSSIRQLAFVDADGGIASHTGNRTMARTCEGEGWGFVVQANGVEPGVLDEVGVCAAMEAYFGHAEGDLATRMIAALEAGAAENDEVDATQRRSAAVIVVGKERRDELWQGRLIDLRVEDRVNALGELRRLVATNKALNLMRESDAYLAVGELEKAKAVFEEALGLAPDGIEIIFWRAVSLAATGHVDESLPYFEEAFAAAPEWRRTVERLPESILLPNDPVLIRKILAVSAGDAKTKKK